MPKKRKTWTIAHGGIRLRLYRRPRSPFVWAELRHDDGRRERFSLEVETNAAAETVALEQAKRLDRERVVGHDRDGAALTFAQLRILFESHRAPLLTATRRTFVERTLELWSAHLEPGGRAFALEDLGEHQVETFIAARESGQLHGADHRASRAGVRAGTIANEISVLVTVCRWATRFRQNGRPLLGRNPLDGVKLPAEKNPRRHRADRTRIDRLRAVARQVDAGGQFAMLLEIAVITGRRITAICSLRASDVLVGAEQVRAALASIGWDESWADHWPAAIRWRSEFDKAGRDWVAPVPAALQAELTAYVRRTGAIGEAWLFPYSRRPAEPLPKNTADHWLRQAEKVANLEHAPRSGWHSFRRAWATDRKVFPMVDVMQTGGWVDAKALQRAYTQADAATILKVAEG